MKRTLASLCLLSLALLALLALRSTTGRVLTPDGCGKRIA